MIRRLISLLGALALASCSIDGREPPVTVGGNAGSADVTPDAGGSGGSAGSDPACEGCSIAGICVHAGAVDPANPCGICAPERDDAAYGPNVSASCGAGPSDCSAQDTCNAAGECAPNDVADGTSCGEAGSGQLCVGGECGACSAASDPDALCAGRSLETPHCDAALGRCVACVPSDCGDAEPVCDPDSGCRACSEHAECPDSACHLSGMNQGECFALAEVVQVPDAATLRTQIGVLIAGEPRVLRLAPTTFAFDEILEIGSAGTELAMLGQPGTRFTGGPTNGAPPLLSVGFDSILYLSAFTISEGPTNAINSSSGSILWLDDMRIDGYPNVGVSGAGAGHIRRSRISADNVALVWQGDSLEMHTTSLGPGALTGMRTLSSPSLDVRYVTIAGNTTSLSCDASPGPSGVIRNSLLTGTADPAISGAACELLTYVGNAVDQAGYGSLIEHYDGGWFSDAASSDFRLTPSGAAAVGTPSTWGSGDPPVDIDDEARPRDRAGAPGIDEP